MSAADATAAQVARALDDLRHEQLTPHFQLWEISQPARHGFGEALYPPEWLLDRGLPLLHLAEKIRARFNRSIEILSAYRPLAYNRAIGGEQHSLHLVGRALDITMEGIVSTVLHAEILRMYSNGDIPELGGLGLYVTSNFCHIDTRPGGRLARWRKE